MTAPPGAAGESSPPPRGPRILRRVLERAGPIWVKLGQHLALRPDLLPREYCDELLGLLEDAEPMPEEELEAILRTDLGPDGRSRLQALEPRPAAVGVLAQVHRATLAGDLEVAVKVRRPGIRERIERDLRRAHHFSTILFQLQRSSTAPARQIVDEIESWMLREIDFGGELDNLVRMRELLAGEPGLRLARPIPSLCGERVLTTEWLEGIPVSHLLSGAAPPAGDGQPARLARTLLETTFTQIFRHHVFHADPHPGNLLALEDGRLGLIDFGLVLDLQPSFRTVQTRFVAALEDGDVAGIVAALDDVLVPGPGVDPVAFRNAAMTEVRGLLVTPGDAGGMSRVGRILVALIHLARRHGYSLPVGTLAMYRALLSAESVARRLGTPADLESVGRDFFARTELDRALDDFGPRRLRRTAAALLSLVTEGPGQAARLLADLAEGRFVLNVYATESPRTESSWNRRVAVLAMAIASVGLAAIVAFVELPTLAGMPLSLPAGLLLLLLYLWLFRAWRRLS